MVVLVTSRVRQALVRSRFYSSIVGDSMLARLRNSTIALLGTVTVVGLGLVAFISQLGFPGVFNGPIPDGPSGPVAVHGAIALTQGTRVGHQEFRGQPVRARTRSFLLDSSSPAVSTDLGSSKQAGHRSIEPLPPVTAHPPSTPAPEPVGEYENPPPAPTTGTPSAPEPNSSGQSEKPSPETSNPKGRSQGKAKGQAEAKPDVSLPGGGSQGHHSAKAKRYSGASQKPSDHSSGKPSSSNDSPGNKSGKPSKSDPSPPKPPSAFPPPEPAEKKSPETGGKETWYAGKSDKSHH